MPQDYLARPHTTRPDSRVAEAEWGADPAFGQAAQARVPSFALGDPWRTINTASVPYWTVFAGRPAVVPARRGQCAGRLAAAGLGVERLGS